TSPDGKRAAPSAGALYPLELYAVTPRQVMHYLPDGHRAVSDLRSGLRAAAVDQSSVGTAPVVIVVAAVPSLLSHRYGARPRSSSRSRSATPPRTSCFRRPPSGLPTCQWAALIPPGRRTPSPCPPIRASCT